MKNTKKLFLSVFALSAMILSACSGGTVTPDTSSTGPAPGTSSTEPAPTPASSSSLAPEESSSLNPEESSSGSEESSSGGGEESSSSEQVEFKADYQIEIGNAKYDLILNEGQTLHTKEYYFGANVSKTVAAGEIITFKKYQNNEYQSFAVAPSPDNETGFTYNNVVKDGNDYKIRASGSVGVYLKLDGTDWSYWISGGGDIPRAEPGYYLRGKNIGSNWSIDPDYKLAQGTGEDSSKYYINYDAVQGDEFKICQVSEDGTETWWPYNAGTDSEPDYKGYYKNSEEAKSAIYKGYLYGDKDYNLQTIIPGNYRIEIDTTDNGIWSSINVNQDSEELLNPLQYGPVDGGMAFDLDFGYLIGGGYKYYASDLDLSEAPEDLSMAFKWKDGSKVIFELDEDKTAEQYFTVDFDNATLTVKEGAEDKVDLTFALQCGKMILSVTKAPVLCNVTFRVKLTSEVEDLRVLGSFNNWKDPNDEFVLNEFDPEEHIYLGQFSIPSGSIKFKFMYGENTWEDTISDRELTIEGNAITPIYVFDKNEVVKEYTMIHVDTSGVAQVAMKEKDANEYTLIGYSLEVGDLIYFNMDGTIKGYSDLKLSEYAQSHFKENTENGYIEVTQAGEFDIYVKVTPESEGEYEGKSIWIGEYTPFVAKEYVFKANDEVIPDTKNIVEQDDEQNNGKYVITFADSDIGKVITIFDEETQLQVGDNSSVKTFTIAKAGEHTFYINNKNPQEVWVTEPKNPEDLLTIKCYLKKEGENVSWWTSNNAVTYAQVWDVVDEVAKNIQFLEVKSITLKGGDVNDNYYEIEIDLGAARPQKILLLRCDPTVVTLTPTSWPSSGVWNQTLDADINYDWDTPGCDLLIKESESALPERYVAVAKNGDWNKMQYVELEADQLVLGNYVARNVSLEAGDVFYLLAAPKDTTNPDGIWKHYDNIAEEGAYANFEDNKDDDHNFKVKEGKTGVYNIFVEATVDGTVTIKERVAKELYVNAEFNEESNVAILDATLVDNKPTYNVEGQFTNTVLLSLYFEEGQLLIPQVSVGSDLIEEVSGRQGVFHVVNDGDYSFTFTYDNNVMYLSVEDSATPVDDPVEYNFVVNSDVVLPVGSNYFVYSWKDGSGMSSIVDNNKVYLLSDAEGFLVAMTTAEDNADIDMDPDNGNISNKSNDAVIVSGSDTIYYYNYGGKYVASSAIYDVTFSVDLSGVSDVTTVSLAGNFNGWDKTAHMTNTSGTIYQLVVKNLPHGFWPSFKFVLNDNWDTCDSYDRSFEASKATTVSYKYNKYDVKVALGPYANDSAKIYAYQYEDADIWYEYDATNNCFHDLLGGHGVQLIRFKPEVTTPSWTNDDIWNYAEEIGLQSYGTLTFKNWNEGTGGKAQFEWK